MRLVRKPHPFDHPDWIFELKLDGFRALAHFENGKCELVSRNRNTFASFRSLAAKIAGHFKGENGILDGEIVSLDERGYLYSFFGIIWKSWAAPNSVMTIN